MAAPSLDSKEGQALVNKLAEVSANMRQAANLADAFAQSVARLFPGTVVAPQPEAPAPVTGKKRGRVPKEGKRIKDPNAPKRPPTSYIMFQNDIREELRKKYPDIPYKAPGKVSEAWAVLGGDEKKAYQNVADANMTKYNRAVVDYKGSLNGHPPVATSSAVPTPTPEADEEEEEEEEEEPASPPTKKAKAEPVALVAEEEEDSDAVSSDSESTPPPIVQPVKKTKASAPASSGKEKKKAKK